MSRQLDCNFVDCPDTSDDKCEKDVTRSLYCCSHKDMLAIDKSDKSRDWSVSVFIIILTVFYYTNFNLGCGKHA